VFYNTVGTGRKNDVVWTLLWRQNGKKIMLQRHLSNVLCRLGYYGRYFMFLL